jgi:sRNA-binding protein
MTTPKAEQKRGYQEGSHKIELLRATWPKAFPAKSHEVRPLASGAIKAVVEAFGWTSPYARAVLMVWKVRPAYCQAILRNTHRINLDGSASDEEIDDEARAMAKERLEKITARRAKDAEKSRPATVAREDDTQTKAPEATPAAIIATKDDVPPKMAEPAPATIPEEKPETGVIAEIAPPIDPPKSRKLLVAGSAAMEAALKRRLASGAMTTEVLKTVPAPSSGRRREQPAR